LRLIADPQIARQNGMDDEYARKLVTDSLGRHPNRRPAKPKEVADSSRFSARRMPPLARYVIDGGTVRADEPIATGGSGSGPRLRSLC